MVAPIEQKAGSITTGGSAQTLFTANNLRVGFWVQNLSVADLYIRDFVDATGGAGDIKIAAGALYETPVNSPVKDNYTIYGGSTGQAFTYKEW